jgi:uncharacterized protein involved in exopolysaccharide biosynthesis
MGRHRFFPMLQLGCIVIMITHSQTDALLAKPSSGISPRDVLRVLFRHKRKALAVFVLVLALTVVGLAIAPRVYVSDAKLYVRIGRESVALDPAAAVGTTLSLQDSRETEIRSVVDVLQSRILLEKVVQHLGAGQVLGDGSRQNSAPQRQSFSLRSFVKWALSRIIPTDQVPPEEQAVRQLQRCVWVDSAKKSSVISVYCKADSPAKAQRILQALLDIYRQEHVKVNATESYEFFQKQCERLRTDLLQATEELGQLKSKLGLTTIADQRQLLESQLTSLDKDIQDTTAAISSAEARLRNLQEQFPEAIEEAGFSVGTTPMAVDQMRDTLYRLQIQEREMASKYQDDHPALQAVREQLRSVERILVRQAAIMENSQLNTLQARLEALNNTRKNVQQHLLALNQNEVLLSQLERRVELLRNTFQKYSELAEQARVARALDEEQVTNVRVVQPPSFVNKAVSPKPTVILIVGFLAATLGSLSIAVAAEMFDYSLQTPEQVEATLHLPVLVAIPRLHQNYLLSSPASG